MEGLVGCDGLLQGGQTAAQQCCVYDKKQVKHLFQRWVLYSDIAHCSCCLVGVV